MRGLAAYDQRSDRRLARMTCGMIDARDHVCVTGLAGEPAGPVTGSRSSVRVAVHTAASRRLVSGYAAGSQSRGNDGSAACESRFGLRLVRRNVASDSACWMGFDDWHDRVDQVLHFVGTDG